MTIAHLVIGGDVAGGQLVADLDDACAQVQLVELRLLELAAQSHDFVGIAVHRALLDG
jgi:hypothetical protein